MTTATFIIIIMRHDYRFVGEDFSTVTYLEGSQIIFQTVSNQNSVGIDESQQVILNVFQRLGWSAFQIFGTDSWESGVVVNNVVFRLYQSFVH